MPSVFWNIGGLGEFREKITEVWRIASATLDLPLQPQGITKSPTLERYQMILLLTEAEVWAKV